MAHRTADVLVVGAGVFGLASAWACARRGMRVIVAEADRPGAGASGGPVGVLSPHPPGPWSARKAFQLEALVAAPAAWAAVRAAGGIDPGYARVGRAIPLPDAGARARAEAQVAAAGAHWRGAGTWEVVAGDRMPAWVAPEAARAGMAIETLSARIEPRRALAALAAAVRARGGEIRCGWRAQHVEDGAVWFERGRLAAGAVVLAAGHAGAGLAPGAPLAGVKGQAAVLAARVSAGSPLVYASGVYVAPQPDGRVAVGSTSEAAWSAPDTTDAGLDAVVARARAMCPALSQAAVVERWAGVRPRAPRPDPMVGLAPGRRRVFLATGGFRTGWALAFPVGELVAGMIAGDPVVVPPGLSVAEHVAADANQALAP